MPFSAHHRGRSRPPSKGRADARHVAAAVVLALALGGFLQFVNIQSLPALAGVLRVGDESTQRWIVEEELGPVPVVEGEGHDGQYYFVTALDPLLLDDARSGAYAAYRQRRVMYPLLASLAGALPAHAALIGIAVTPVLGLAAACGFSAAMARRDRWLLAVAAVLANPGMWMSVALATGDTVALAFALGGLTASLRRRPLTAALLFAAAALAKETHLVFALATAAWHWSRGEKTSAAKVGGIPVGALAVWMMWVQFHAASPGVGAWNFGLPFQGIWDALPGWSGGEGVLSGLTLVALALASWAVLRPGPALLRFNLVPWILFAVFTAEVVWRDGNNAARALAPLLTLALLGWIVTPDPQPERTSRKNLPV